MERWLLLVCGMAVGASAAAGCGDDDAVADAAMDGAPADAGVADAVAADAASLYSFLSVERWSRAGVTHTMAAVVMFHQDDTLPRIRRVNQHCVVHEGLWTSTAPLPFGDIRLSGTSQGEVALWPDGYETPIALGAGWNAGDPMTVVAAGGTARGFRLSGAVPPTPTLTSHDLTQPGPGQIVLARDQPFALTWTPVDGEVFALILELDNDILPSRGVQCFFPGAAGAGSIPAAAFAHLLPQAAVHHTNFYFSRVVRERVVVEGVDVDLAIWNGSATRIEVQ